MVALSVVLAVFSGSRYARHAAYRNRGGRGCAFGDVRVITNHLEWYSLAQRSAQVDALRIVYADGYAHARAAEITMNDGGPFQTSFVRPRATISATPFNLEHDSALHAKMISPFLTAHLRSPIRGTNCTRANRIPRRSAFTTA